MTGGIDNIDNLARTTVIRDNDLGAIKPRRLDQID